MIANFGLLLNLYCRRQDLEKNGAGEGKLGARTLGISPALRCWGGGWGCQVEKIGGETLIICHKVSIQPHGNWGRMQPSSNKREREGANGFNYLHKQKKKLLTWWWEESTRKGKGSRTRASAGKASAKRESLRGKREAGASL